MDDDWLGPNPYDLGQPKISMLGFSIKPSKDYRSMGYGSHPRWERCESTGLPMLLPMIDSWRLHPAALEKSPHFYSPTSSPRKGKIQKTNPKIKHENDIWLCNPWEKTIPKYNHVVTLGYPGIIISIIAIASEGVHHPVDVCQTEHPRYQ